MKVKVKLFATFQTGRFDVAEQEYPPGISVVGIVDALGIPRKEIGVTLVNNRHAELQNVVEPGDVLSIFPLLGGG